MPSQVIHSIYGLRVRSDLALPSKGVPIGGPIDLFVLQGGEIPRPAAPPQTVVIDWHCVEHGWLLRYHTRTNEALEFVFNREATRLRVCCTSPEMTEDIAALLVGAGLAAALYLRGVLALHASAVVVDGKAILVTGSAGAGKSTLTAALVGHGMPLLSEDIAAVTFDGDGIAIQSGYPRLRLRPDAAPVVGLTSRELPRVFGPRILDDKRWIDATTLRGGFCATPVPLGVIYLLAPRHADRGTLAIESLPRHRAALALLDHLYGARWLRIPKATALAWCARIAGQIPVRIVHAPSGLERVGETAKSIVADCRSAVAAT